MQHDAPLSFVMLSIVILSTLLATVALYSKVSLWKAGTNFPGFMFNFERLQSFILHLDCGECTSARSQWEGCIQSKSTWLMFIYLFSLRRWKYLGSIQCKHLEYTAYFWKGNIRIYANLVG